MEERILKKTAIFVASISLAACMALPFFPDLNKASLEFIADVKEYRTKTRAQRMNMTGLELMAYNNEQVEKETGKKLSLKSQIRLELPLGVSGSDLTITNDPLAQTIAVKIPYAGEEYIYEYPILGNGGHMESMEYKYEGNYGIVEFLMEKVYEVDSSYDNDYLYINFLTPHMAYDKVVVIDAGHGGDDAGAIKQGISEKDINLDIVLQLKEILDASEESVGIYYTRTKDETVGKEQRIRLANNTEADLFLSIHANTTQSGRMSSINGTQVMYGEQDLKPPNDSKGLAEICLEEVTGALLSSNKGTVAENDGYMLLGSNVPTALIKVGFMTNQTELEKLCSREYQNRAAQGIYQAIVRAFAEGY